MTLVPKVVKDKVISLLKCGHSTRIVASQCSVSQSFVQKQRKKHCSSLPASHGGRPKLMSAADKRKLARYIQTGEASTASMAANLFNCETGKHISKWTAMRSLKESNFESGEKKKKPMISKKNVKARLAFAKKYKSWTVEQWKTVIWSDETKINRYTSDGRSWFWKRRGESLKPQHVKQTVKHGGGSIMIWGCMTAYGPGSLHRIEGRMDQHVYKDILQNCLYETVENMPIEEAEVVFQHDRDPKHMAKSVQNWLQDQSFGVLDWPAQSPDLNPIEHLWAHLKKRLHHEYHTPPTSCNNLWSRVQEEWENINPNYCEKLVESLPRRIEAVLKAKGYWTKY